MKDKAEHYALITGASEGLGKALAEELARRKHRLLLVALPGTGLPLLSAELAKEHDVQVRFFETDLTRIEAPAEIKKYSSEQKLMVDILVNNVGIGHGGGIGDYSTTAIEESVFLNMRCITLMTNIFIDDLKQRGRAYILNIGSFGGFLPMPHKSIYSATKSYIYHFSLAIREELRGTGVSVSVAMPGPILTNHKVRKRVEQQGFVARSNVMDANKAAAFMVERMFRGRALIIPRWTMRLAYSVASWLPYPILMIILGRLFKGVD
jgi:short-subunit dehydrogenase